MFPFVSHASGLFFLKKNNWKKNWRTRILFVAPRIPLFWIWWCLPWVLKPRCYLSLEWVLACMQRIPQIHLWCDTCQPFGGQHGSCSHSPQACRRGRMLQFHRYTSRKVSRHAIHSVTAIGLHLGSSIVVRNSILGFFNFCSTLSLSFNKLSFRYKFARMINGLAWINTRSEFIWDKYFGFFVWSHIIVTFYCWSDVVELKWH